MLEQRTYRGRTREEATASYHADALNATRAGYVPVGQQWGEAFEQPSLTVTYEHRPGEVGDVLRLLTDQRLASPQQASAALRARIEHYRSRGYTVVAETPTAAQLVKSHKAGVVDYLAFGVFGAAMQPGDLTVHLAVAGDGSVTESGTAIERERAMLGGFTRTQLTVFLALVVVVAVAWLLVEGLAFGSVSR